MTEQADYEKLLDKAYAKVPAKSGTGERFEMPAFETLMQGNKTIVKNFKIVVEKIRREPEFLIKYLSKELAVPITMEGDKLTLHGKFYDRVLNEKLTNFVNAFVICKECKRPDTKIVGSDRGVKFLVCEACGARAPVKA